mgnify:CR=1 FL=1
MRSKRSLENYLLIDNRCSGEGMQEMPTLTCCHCHIQVKLNPMRTRDRHWCWKCDAYVCDHKSCIEDCNGSLNRVFDRLQEENARKLWQGDF